MKTINFTEDQQRIQKIPLQGSMFLAGEAGTGKTTCGIHRLDQLLVNFRGDQILVLVPQRSLGKPYFEFFRSLSKYSGSLPTIVTLGGLTRRMVDLYWPLISKAAGFKDSAKQPTFLSTETSQYCMEKVISPLISQGFFQSVVLSRNRIYSQILDSLNKSAIIRFPINEIAQRLQSVANIDAGLSRAYDQVLISAQEFRKYCLANGLLDYSLQIEVFVNYLWNQDFFKEYFYRNFRALVSDNIEEDVPITHDLIKEWIPNLDSSLIIFDQNGGFRSFLGADPENGLSIKSVCNNCEILDKSINVTENSSLKKFSSALIESILHIKTFDPELDFSDSLDIHDYHFYPQMITNICLQVEELIKSHDTEPGDIVIISPYLSDALNFSLSSRLNDLGIPHRSSRPSRMYFDDPNIRAFFTFAKLAHPQWNLPISSFELRNSLMVVLPNLDIVKADLIVKTLFSVKQSNEGLRSFDTITNHEMQERISFHMGEKLEKIRFWIKEYQSADPQPLDVFFCMIFGELFSQKGFNIFTDFNAATRISQITQSIFTFRQFLTQVFDFDAIDAGHEYIRSVENGLLPSAIISNVEINENSVMIAPAHSFLMENRKVKYQFWLDVGSLGWWERLNQPLTNPYLLNRNKDKEQLWTEAFEFNANQAGMLKIVNGLLTRCGKKVYVNTVQTNEYGSEQRGPLLQAFHTLQKRTFRLKGGNRV
jgi:hypothetical protein